MSISAIKAPSHCLLQWVPFSKSDKNGLVGVAEVSATDNATIPDTTSIIIINNTK